MLKFPILGILFLNTIIGCIPKRFENIHSLFKDIQINQFLGWGFVLNEEPKRKDPVKVLSLEYFTEVEKLLTSMSAIEIIRGFNLILKEELVFALFFWYNLDEKFEDSRPICGVYIYMTLVWETVFNSVLTFVKKNLLLLHTAERQGFAEAVLEFYYSKLRVKYCHVFGPYGRILSNADEEFCRLSKNLASNFYEYQFIDEIININDSVIHAYYKIIAKPDKFEYQTNFFLLIRCLLTKNPSHYEILTWLIDQNSKFIKWFLLFNYQQTINEEEFKKIVNNRPNQLTLFRSLRRVAPIFKIDPELKWDMNAIQEIYTQFSSLKQLTLKEIKHLLNRFHKILSLTSENS
jgi:hypothetical protein